VSGLAKQGNGGTFSHSPEPVEYVLAVICAVMLLAATLLCTVTGCRQLLGSD
jgi:hypothetical protein